MKKSTHLQTLLAMLLLAFLNTMMAAPNDLPAVVKLADTWIETEKTPTYHGWPTLARLKDGRLAAVCSGHRTGHIDPFGRVYLYTSDDDGLTWSAPRTLSAGPLEDHLRLLVKAVLVTVAWVAGMEGLKRLPITIATTIKASRPVFVLLLSILIFGERLNAWQWAGSIVALIAL